MNRIHPRGSVTQEATTEIFAIRAGMGKITLASYGPHSDRDRSALVSSVLQFVAICVLRMEVHLTPMSHRNGCRLTTTFTKTW